MIAYIDGDIIRYQIGSIQQRHPILKDQKMPADKDFVERHTQTIIDSCMEATGATACKIFFTGENNFRFEIATVQPYKGHRSELVKPPNWDTVDEYIKGVYEKQVSTTYGFEADDAMAMSRFKVDSYNYCICTRDKDLTTVPGYHYRWRCGESQPEVPMHFISVFEAWKFFFYQCLIGDSTDSILGCATKDPCYWGSQTVLVNIFGLKVRRAKSLLSKALRSPWAASIIEARFGITQVERRQGVGSEEASGILKDCETLGDMKEAVEAQYKLYYPDNYEEILLENARLLYMGQAPRKLFDWRMFEPFVKVNGEPDDKSEFEYRRIFDARRD